MQATRHVTTRRGVIAGFGFGGVSLYALWAGYGAAPGPMALFGPADPEADRSHGAGGHGAGHGDAGRGPAAAEFRHRVERFVDRYRTDDGSVHPRHLDAAAPAADADHAAHHSAPAAPTPATAADRDEGAPLDVYMIAERYHYEPSHLRLDAGVRYRFRMMATDVSHGASIQFGRGARMIRLRPNVPVEMEAVFERPGSFLVHCTVYCGVAHDVMQARIDVV